MFLPFRGHPLPRTPLLSLTPWSAPTQSLKPSSALSCWWLIAHHSLWVLCFHFWPAIGPHPYHGMITVESNGWVVFSLTKTSELPPQWQRWFCPSLTLQHTVVSSGCSDNLNWVASGPSEWRTKISQDGSRLWVCSGLQEITMIRMKEKCWSEFFPYLAMWWMLPVWSEDWKQSCFPSLGPCW